LGKDKNLTPTTYLWPGPVYNCVTNASKTKIAVNRAVKIPENKIMTGTLARILSSRFHHGKPGVYCARRFSTRKDPRVPQRRERMRSCTRHHSTKETDQTRRRVE
jgi:hypothetical protein